MRNYSLIAAITLLCPILSSNAGAIDPTVPAHNARRDAEFTSGSGGDLAGLSDKGSRIKRLEHIRFTIRTWRKWDRMPVGAERTVLHGTSA